MQQVFFAVLTEGTVPLTLAEIQFYCAVLVAASLAGAFRSIRDSDYHSIGNFCGLCGCSGLIGFSCVSFLCGSNGGAIGRELYYLGIAACVGLLGKEGDQLIRFIVKTSLTKLGVPEKKSGKED